MKIDVPMLELYYKFEANYVLNMSEMSKTWIFGIRASLVYIITPRP